MSIRKIILFPDRGLSQQCESIFDFGEPLKILLEDLKDTLRAGPGVGLAAPQIGVNKRISLIDIHRNKREAYFIVNPEIVSGQGEQTPREGCLSIPDLLANVKRFQTVEVRALNERGEEKIIRAQGFESLALQHEIDHLNGKLFLDRVTNLKTDIFRRKKY